MQRPQSGWQNFPRTCAPSRSVKSMHLGMCRHDNTQDFVLCTPAWRTKFQYGLHCISATGLTRACIISLVRKKKKEIKYFLLNHNNILLSSDAWASGRKKIIKVLYITARWEDWDFCCEIWFIFNYHALLHCLALALVVWCWVSLWWIQERSYIR